MNEKELVRLMDAYMGSGGFYMKPEADENGKNSFYIANDNADSSYVKSGFEHIDEAMGEKEEKPSQTFMSEPREVCVNCAAIPNISDIDSE